MPGNYSSYYFFQIKVLKIRYKDYSQKSLKSQFLKDDLHSKMYIVFVVFGIEIFIPNVNKPFEK